MINGWYSGSWDCSVILVLVLRIRLLESLC